MKNLALSRVYQMLEPGPVVMLTTAHKGRANVMTMSWHMCVEFEPPRIACVVSDGNYSFKALRTTKQCVIAIPAVKLATKVVAIGNCHGNLINKFESFGLTPVPAAHVVAPLIAQCFVNLECNVVDTRLVKTYSIFVLEVVKAWVDPAQNSPKTIHHHGFGTFRVDGATLKIKSRMP